MYGNQQLEWVRYFPPKSTGFGHQARRRNARLAWDMTRSFLEEFTVSFLRPRIELQCYDPTEYTSEIASRTSVDKARNLFGQEDPSYPLKLWRLTRDQLQPALELALENDCWPQERIGPVRLSFGYTFTWQDLMTKPVPSGDPFLDEAWLRSSSDLAIILDGHTLFLQPDFSFPLPWDSPDFISFLDRIEKRVPFRFRDQYFKRLLPSKDGRHLRTLKLTKGWR